MSKKELEEALRVTFFSISNDRRYYANKDDENFKNDLIASEKFDGIAPFDFLKDYQASCARIGVATFSHFDAKTGRGKLLTDQGCHAAMGTASVNFAMTDFISSCWLPKEWDNNEQGKAWHRRWVEFIMNPEESPFRAVLKNIKLIENPRLGSIHAWHISDPELYNLPKLAVHALCVTARQSFEKRWVVETWNFFVENGIDELEAFFILTMFQINGRLRDEKDPTFHTYTNPGHWAFYGSRVPLRFTNLKLGNLVNIKRGKLGSSCSYFGNTDIFYQQDDLDAQAKELQIPAYAIEDGGWPEYSIDEQRSPHRFMRKMLAEVQGVGFGKKTEGNKFANIMKRYQQSNGTYSDKLKMFKGSLLVEKIKEHRGLYLNDGGNDVFTY